MRIPARRFSLATLELATLTDIKKEGKENSPWNKLQEEKENFYVCYRNPRCASSVSRDRHWWKQTRCEKAPWGSSCSPVRCNQNRGPKTEASPHARLGRRTVHYPPGLGTERRGKKRPPPRAKRNRSAPVRAPRDRRPPSGSDPAPPAE